MQFSHLYTRAKPIDQPTAAIPSASDELLTVAEACAELRVSKWTLYQFIRSRKLASVKLRSRRLIPRSAIRALVEKLTIEEIV